MYPSLACLAGLAGLALADTTWITPGPTAGEDYRNNPILEVGEEWDLEWETDATEVTLTLVQFWPSTTGDDESSWEILPDYSESTYTWNVTLENVNERYLNESTIILYWSLSGQNSTGDDVGALSRNFNVTVPEEPTASPTETDPPEETGSGDSGLSTGAVAGIAVGASVGGLALIGGLGFLFWRKRKGGSGAATITSSPQSQMQNPMSPATVYHQQQQQQPMLQEHYKPAVYEQNSMYGQPQYGQPVQYGYAHPTPGPSPGPGMTPGVAPGQPYSASPPSTQVYEAPSEPARDRVVHEAP